jgi:hypothetical protein
VRRPVTNAHRPKTALKRFAAGRRIEVIAEANLRLRIDADSRGEDTSVSKTVGLVVGSYAHEKTMARVIGERGRAL